MMLSRVQFVALAFLAHEVPFWAYCAFEFICTRYGLLRRYKIESKQPEHELVARSYRQVAVAHLVFQVGLWERKPACPPAQRTGSG